MGSRFAVFSSAVLVLLAACTSGTSTTSSPPPASPTEATLPANDAPPAAPIVAAASPGIFGTIGGKPFTAHIALMTARDEPFMRCSTANKPDGQCSTDTDGHAVTISTIMIFERPVTCADVHPVRGQRRGFVPLSPGERVVEIAVDSRWPVPAGSAWNATAGTAANGSDDPISITFKATTGSWNGMPLGNGSVAKGVVRFPNATPSAGVMSIDAASTNPSTAAAGSIRGTVPVAICR